MRSRPGLLNVMGRWPVADGSAPTEVRNYPRDQIDPWAKNPRTGPLHVDDIVATLMADGKRPEPEQPMSGPCSCHCAAATPREARGTGRRR
jgi:hypothetical protein